jgi:D-ribulokinase
LTGRYGVSDWNNALKLGYDPQRLCWPEWVTGLVPAQVGLPDVSHRATRSRPSAAAIADELGWPATTRVLAGTTDSTAAVVAAGCVQARRRRHLPREHAGLEDPLGASGDGLRLRDLQPSLRRRLAGRRRIQQRRRGLAQHFSDAEIASLSRGIDPERPSGLDYYPLIGPGERFPRNDPDLAPRLSPRPSDPRDFLQGLLEGIARIEAEGYARLAELGAPPPRRIASIGGGAANPTWTAMRERGSSGSR